MAPRQRCEGRGRYRGFFLYAVYVSRPHVFRAILPIAVSRPAACGRCCVAPAARAKGAKAASVAAEAGSWPAVFLGVQTKRARVRMAILGRWSGRCAAEQ
eukprot:scaffold4545_cov111-Isochrysis_galbana.AAC.15